MTQNFEDAFRKQLFNFENKDDRYDQKIASKLLQSLGYGSLAVKADLGEDFTLAQINQRYMPPGIAFETAKLKKPVELHPLFSGKATSTEYWKTYLELQQNWSNTNHFILVFDRHDDKVSDLVLHSAGSLINPLTWLYSFVGPDKLNYYIQSFKDFLVTFSLTFNENKQHGED